MTAEELKKLLERSRVLAAALLGTQTAGSLYGHMEAQTVPPQEGTNQAPPRQAAVGLEPVGPDTGPAALLEVLEQGQRAAQSAAGSGGQRRPGSQYSQTRQGYGGTGFTADGQQDGWRRADDGSPLQMPAGLDAEGVSRAFEVDARRYDAVIGR